MGSSSTGHFSRAARARFTEIVARIEEGDAVDLEHEFARQPELSDELRRLHTRWSRVEGWLGELSVAESDLDSVERALRGPEPLDEITEAELARLADPDRSRRRYERIELVAAGGMGEVWRVLDRDLGRELAQKRLKTRSRDPRLLRRFLAEAKLTARLEHPGIVPVHDSGIDADGSLWFTMPLVRGENLARILEPNREFLPEALEALLKACDAVAYAHARGVVHRDLKPANILLGPFGEVYVVDWGLARSSASRAIERSGSVDAAPAGPSDTRHGDVLGTPAYMPPEQAAGGADSSDPRVDVYALGAVLWHVLAGRPPYIAVAGTSVIEALLSGPPESLSSAANDAPAELASIAEKAMSRDPAQRYADVRELAEDLRAFLAGRVVRAHRTGPITELRKWCRRNRALSATSAFATLAIVVVLSSSYWQKNRDAAEILRLADVARLRDLEQQAEALGPASPSSRGSFEAWLVEAERLAERRGQHEDALASLRGSGSFADGTWTFAKDEDGFRHALLTELVAGLDRLGGEHRGLTGAIRERWELARSMEDESLVRASDAWTRTIAELAGDAGYRGIPLEPIVGLVPIGRDPETRFFEFAHLPSGSRPSRDANGRLVIDDASAIVLVLLPGGRFHLGANGPGAGRDAIADPWARADEGPRRQVEIAPFLVAKHEVSRAQWGRLSTRVIHKGPGSGLLPADSIAFDEARRALERAGLEIPTEAQWEYAARGGTTTRWWTGNDPGSLRGAVNGRASVDPRFSAAASSGPIGLDALRANGFGLHHVLGNLAEWTLDPWASDPTIGLSDRDGGRLTGDTTRRALRGGSFASDAIDLRSTARTDAQVDLRDRRIGVRPCRRL